LIVTREQWGAVYGDGYDTDGAKTLVVVHHDGPYPSRSQRGMTVEQESKIVRMYEDFHANGEPGKPGLTATNKRIAYTALFFQTGNEYEGCGFGHVGAHTKDHNSSAYGAFFPLAGDRDAPTPEALAAFHRWRARGVKEGHLSPRHVIKGHQDFNKPACPGKLVYAAAVLGVPLVQPTVLDVVKAHPTLREGKGGLYSTAAERESVRYLQRLLGMADRHRTGFFGPLTAAAVEKFQRAHNLKPDRIVGPKTWAALEGKITHLTRT
jgi:hypothetical protein